MINIGIVDDHAVIRAGLKALLSQEEDFFIAGEACNGKEALDLLRTTHLHVMLMDLSMPGRGGLDSIAAIRAKAPELRVLIYTGLPEENYAVSLLQQGSAGFLNKDCDPSEVAVAVRTVVRGKRYISPSVANLLIQRLDEKKDSKPHEQLTEREFQVFLRLARGERTTAIADGLFLSIKTVSTYRSRIMEKMGLIANQDLTYYAVKHQLID